MPGPPGALHLMRCAVIGDPADHSLSPAIHRAGYTRHCLEWSYEALTVAPRDLAAFVRPKLHDPEWAGLSVTAPHKEAICQYGQPDHMASLVGGGNTIVFGDQPQVYNTDIPGFVRAWRAHGSPRLRSAGIVGNGATARSLLVAMAGLEVREVTVLARATHRAAALVELGTALGITCEVVSLDEPLGGLDLIASTIPPQATASHAAAWAEAAAVLFDVVYDPWPTPLASAAAARGRMALNGLDLLAGQAVDQFFRFTNTSITFEAARAAAVAELRRRSVTQ
ncbi:MAG: shikimate dehydrogenase family protein [Arachnia sp.]